MTSPFPGMDPYLEMHWGDVHTRLTVYARDQLQPQMPLGLCARIEEYLSAELVNSLDERQTLLYIKIINCRFGNPIVTAIEFLSQANKRTEAGRSAYRKKQREFVDDGTNLVEIDLLREGEYVLAAPIRDLQRSSLKPCRISVMRAANRDQFELWIRSYREPLPTIRIPLRESDNDITLNLQSLIDATYVNGNYGDTDYRQDPVPPLADEDARWADQLLKEKGLR